MSEAVVDDIVAVLPPLLQALQALSYIVRRLDPSEFSNVMDEVGVPDETLQAARAHLTEWPDGFAEIRAALDTASEAALAAFAGLRAVQGGEGDLMSAFRALRYVPRAMEALYPLAAGHLWSILLDVTAVGVGGALGTVMQTRLMDVAGDAQALAAALNHAAFNAANALGPSLGGLAIAAGYGWTSTGWVGCGLALAGLFVWAISVRADGIQRAAEACV